MTGDGPNFSSGIDTSVFTSGNNGSPSGIDIGGLQSSFTVFETISKPTIAAIAGPTFGAGLQLAIACDFRVAADDTELSD